MKKQFLATVWRSPEDPLILSSLPHATKPYFRSAIALQLAAWWNEMHPLPSSANLFAQFIEWICNQRAQNPNHPRLQRLFEALKQYQEGKEEARVSRVALVERLRFSFTDSNRLEFVESLPVLSLPELREPYPPKGFWWYETNRVRKRWETIILEGKQADARKRRHLLHKVQPQMLQYTIYSDSSTLIRDPSTGELVLMVLRGFCRDSGVLNWVDGVVREVIAQKRSVRLEDPGKLALIGYSAGSLNAPKFDWVKNLLRHLPEGAIEDLDSKSSAVFALFWNMLLKIAPSEVLQDFEEFFDRTGIVRMTPGSNSLSNGSSSGEGAYTIITGAGDPERFSTGLLAPPQGVFALNYSRAGHLEHQPHKYAASWTTGRTGTTSKGGAFYLSSYGIHIEPAANTLVIWKPGNVHGTSLQDRLLEQPDPYFSQSGLAIVTSSRLPSVWAKYQQDLIAQVDAANDLESGPAEEDDSVNPPGCYLPSRECPICLPDSELSDDHD